MSDTSTPMLQEEQLPSAKALKTAAFAQSLRCVSCMRNALPALSYAPIMSTLIPTVLLLSVSSSKLYFGLSVTAAFFSVMTFNRNWSFLIGTITADMPLVIGLPHFLLALLSLIGAAGPSSLSNLPTNASYLHHSISASSYGNLGFAAFVLSCFNFLVSVYHLYHSLQARTNTRIALQQAGYNIAAYPSTLSSIFPFELAPFATTRRTKEAVLCKKDVIYSRVPNVTSCAPILEKYMDGTTLNLSADIYHHPSSTSTTPPVLLYVHGGAWFLGAKDLGVIMPLIDRAAKDGYVVVSIDYRLCPASKFPDFIIDVKSAIKYIRDGSLQADLGFDVDSSTIVLAGDSAGGHINNLVALSQNDPYFQPGFEKTDTSVQGFIDMFGPADGRKKHEDIFSEIVIQRRYKGNEDVPEISAAFDRVSPITYDLASTFDKPSPIRWLHFHGTNDGLVPIEENRAYYSKIFAAVSAITGAPFDPAPFEVGKGSAGVGMRKVAHVELKGSFHGFCGFLSIKTLAFCDAASVVLEDVKVEGRKRREGVGVGDVKVVTN